MPKRVFDICRKFGLHPSEVITKAEGIGISGLKVASSILDDASVARLDEELHKANPNPAAKSTPKNVVEGRNELGFVAKVNDFKNSDADLATPLQMKPCLKDRRVAEVLAGISWDAALEHRIYSCPDTPDYDFAFGATALILKNGYVGARVPLEVCDVATLPANESAQINELAEPYRTRAANYLAEVGENPVIIQPGNAHRLYFLSPEPWPDWLQALTTPQLCAATEWTSILSICVEPERFFEWPKAGSLLWPCIRLGEEQEHVYPPNVAARLTRLGLPLDRRNNGPAILSYLSGGGKRPAWGSEGWPIHHIYDGTGSVHGGPQNILHAVRDSQHFTHSAGLVAAHPVAHHLVHQSDLLKWLLRREAFLRFGYDPMKVFSSP